MRQVDTGIGRT